MWEEISPKGKKNTYVTVLSFKMFYQSLWLLTGKCTAFASSHPQSSQSSFSKMKIFSYN